MTIIEALNEICKKQIPKEINGVKTKYIVKERRIFKYPEVLVSILPINIRKDNIGTARNYAENYYMTYDFTQSTLGYKHLEQDIKELLCLYIRNIISFFKED